MLLNIANQTFNRYNKPISSKCVFFMYNPQDQLTELVRNLEQKGHVFSADPMLITEKLQKEPSSPLTKLHHRASRIDSDNKLANALATLDSRVNGVIWIATMVWFALGFVSILGVMQIKTLNFFYILLTVLGFHTIMLVVWLGWLIVSPKNKPTFFSSFFQPDTLMRGKDAVTLATVEVYQQQLLHTGTKWFFGRISHQLWLASLLGMLASLLLLFLVQRYTFVWESTLLQNHTVTLLVKYLGYLPSLVGFPVPTEQDIIIAQTYPTANLMEVSFRWAMLLIGSLLMYGIVPRLFVWAWCFMVVRSSRLKLDLKQPYYQKIIDFWQRKVIDPDDSPTEQKPIAPTAQVSQAKKLVALFEYPYPDNYWYQFAVGHQIDDFGIIDGREDIERLLNYLQQENLQVLIGIPPQCLPDRGTMRKLDMIANHAKGGLIVQLLNNHTGYILPDNEQQLVNQRLEQWETALAERQIGLVRI